MSEPKKTRKRAQAVVLPSFSIKKVKEGDSLFLRVDWPTYITKVQTGKDGKPEIDKDTGEEKVLHLIAVTDIDTGEQGEMVLPYLVRKGLDAVFAVSGDLTGKEFEFVKGAKKNRTDEWTVYPLIAEDEPAKVKSVK